MKYRKMAWDDIVTAAKIEEFSETGTVCSVEVQSHIILSP